MFYSLLYCLGCFVFSLFYVFVMIVLLFYNNIGKKDLKGKYLYILGELWRIQKNVPNVER